MPLNPFLYPRLKFTPSLVASLFPEQCMGTRTSVMVSLTCSSVQLMCSSVSFPCPQLLQEISRRSGLGLQENIGSRHGEPVPHLLPSSVSPSSCGSFSTCEHFALSEHCLPQCATSVAAGLTTYDI